MQVYGIHLPISFRVVSLALGQSYDCPSASKATLKDMGKTDQYLNTAKHLTQNHVHGFFSWFFGVGVGLGVLYVIQAKEHHNTRNLGLNRNKPISSPITPLPSNLINYALLRSRWSC